jgi:ribosome biogenesis GTPase
MNENKDELSRGILIRGIGSFYTVRDPGGNEYTLRCKKKFRHQGMSPMTGDEVVFSKGEGESHGWIEEILPRKTVCLRPPVANVEVLILVISPVPEPDLILADRQISRAFAQDMEVMIAVNKSDLDHHLASEIQKQYLETGIPVYEVSAREKTGLEDFA